MIEMPCHRKHPIPTQNITGGLFINIVIACSADPGITIEKVIHLHLYDQLIMRQVPADISIPKQNRSIGRKSTRPFLPGIAGIRIKLEVPDKKESNSPLMVLRPVTDRSTGVYTTHLVEIRKSGIKLQTVLIDRILTHAKTTTFHKRIIPA